MEPANAKEFPWRTWTGFAAWAQDFSLMQKVLGGFLAVTILVGLLTGFIGTRLVRQAVIDRARSELHTDLETAQLILKNSQESLEARIRLMAASEKIEDYLESGDTLAIRDRLGMLAVENDLDFLSVADEKGNIVASALAPHPENHNVSSDLLVAKALTGDTAAGITILSAKTLSEENPPLAQRLGAKHKSVMVIEAACPLRTGVRVSGTLYGGIVLNGSLIVNRIAQQLFKGKLGHEQDAGQVTIYQGRDAISTTLKGADGLPIIGFEAGAQIQKKVLEQGNADITWETLFNSEYLSATAPIRDASAKIAGAIQVAAPEKPITAIITRLVTTFMVVALIGVLLMGAISYFLVKWINRPLEQMLHAARRAAEGDLTHEVPVVARDEVGELAATFNLMIRNLSDSKKRLEEWGKDLASKVAEQTGELHEAREQVARVKKLASLEKMADGMAHIMAHISDPMLTLPDMDEATEATNRVLVLDSEEKVLDICRRILQNEGFDVKTTSSVPEALSELETEFFDVVIADIVMPEMSGKELLKEIKYRQPEVAVILTAPFRATEEAVEAVKLGAYDYIPKPFGPHQILLMVYTALQGQEMLKKTRRQHAEQRAETIFQRLPVAIALADKEHRVVYHNRAFIELATHDGQVPDPVRGKTFGELFGIDPLASSKGDEEGGGSMWLQLEKLGRTAKLYNFKLPEEDLRVLMLLDVTETVMKDQQAHVFKEETINKAQQVIHQQMRVAQEIAGLLGETTAETKAALFELIKLAGEGEVR
jgi:DNA-binding response OmpR family regulator/HAMP domain-containing protein